MTGRYVVRGSGLRKIVCKGVGRAVSKRRLMGFDTVIEELGSEPQEDP
jgi:hypothetical protein